METEVLSQRDKKVSHSGGTVQPNSVYEKRPNTCGGGRRQSAVLCGDTSFHFKILFYT